MSLISVAARSDRLKAMLRPVVNRVVGTGHRTVKVRGGEAKGLRMIIDPQVEKYYWTGSYEPEVQGALANHLRPGMTFWDVGGHVGFFALQAARHVGSHGFVVAFEPMAGNASRLRENATLNQLTVHIVNAGVGDTSGRAVIHAAKGGSTLMWTLAPQAGSQPHGEILVTTLDDQLTELAPPNVVKVDAEGLEPAVLRGARRLIREYQPVFILEFVSDAHRAEGEAALPGYDLMALGRGHWEAVPT